MPSTDASHVVATVATASPDVTIALDPHRPGRHRARLVEYGVPVWALIAHLQGVDGDTAQTAHDYAIPEEAVRAALTCYEFDPSHIDAFLLLHRDGFETIDESTVLFRE